MLTSMLALLSLLGAQAQDEVYKSLQTGDRVEVTFRNGNTLTGSLAAPPSAQLAPKKKAGSGGEGPPFFLYAFLDPESGESASQMAALEAWRKRHPAAPTTPERIRKGSFGRPGKRARSSSQKSAFTPAISGIAIARKRSSVRRAPARAVFLERDLDRGGAVARVEAVAERAVGQRRQALG